MSKLFKPQCLLLYLLVIVVFFFVGIVFAGITGAAKGQGLAGGAIILFYGLISAFLALVLSMIFTSKAELSQVVRANKILGLLSLFFIGFFTVKFMLRANKTSSENIEQNLEAKPIATEVAESTIPPKLNPPTMGLGFFKPKFSDGSKLHFYGHINPKNTVSEHSSTDSIVFHKTEHGNIDIAEAPPWLVPAHLKLDYGIFLFKLLSVKQDFLELVVNETNGQTGIVDKSAGDILYWPEFLMTVNSVEPINRQVQTIHLKPLDQASALTTDYAFLKPIEIKEDWLKVELMSDGFEVQGEGWIRWNAAGELLISYSLLS